MARREGPPELEFWKLPARRLTHCSAGRIAAILGLLAVTPGAFGAHSLKDLLAQNGTATVSLVPARDTRS